MPPARAAQPAAAESALSPVYALVGPDPYLQQRALAGIAGKLGPDVQRADIDGPSAGPAEVFDELRSFAMFGGRRLVVVRDADEFVSRHREALEDFLDGLGGGGGNVLVLRCTTLPKNTRVHKLIDKVGQVIACQPPEARELPAWIVRQGREAHGLTVSAEAAALLADLIGADLGTLDNELAKLALQSSDARVKPDMIAGGVAFRREQEMWRLTDALTAGRPEEAMRIWRQLTATDPAAEFKAVTWLGIWLEKAVGALRLADQGRRPFDIAREMKIWPAQNVEPLLRTARSLGPAGLRRMTDRLAELDYRTKTGLGEAARSVEDFIASVAR